jgi:replicative superfamily II helicase
MEDGFRCGAISVLVATSTVATGVNLPARRVIVRDTYIGQPKNALNATRFRQMCGRAGRAGIDSKGEAIVMVTSSAPSARQAIEALITAEVLPLACDRRSEGGATAVVTTGALSVILQVLLYTSVSASYVSSFCGLASGAHCTPCAQLPHGIRS